MAQKQGGAAMRSAIMAHKGFKYQSERHLIMS